jgi:hypothetical protein
VPDVMSAICAMLMSIVSDTSDLSSKRWGRHRAMKRVSYSTRTSR